MILNWSAAEREPVLSFQETRRFGRRRLRVFDRLGLVKYHEVEFSVLEVHGIASQCPVSRDNQIVVFEMFAALSPFRANMSQQAQSRSESCRFLLPIEDERTRYNYERRPRLCFRRIRTVLLRRLPLAIPFRSAVAARLE